jgi:hypothetical protein
MGAMKSMRSTWTDSRLDDLKSSVDSRLDDLKSSVDARLDDLNGRVDDLSQRMEAGFARVDGDIRELRGAIGALNRTILQVGGGMMGIVLIGFLGLIAT